jgi:large subunit ribosomal protein L15
MSYELNFLKKVKENYKKRIGRGIGSGKGKTSGRGVKGQKARTGHHSVKGFEGGQTPVHMRLPKKGFKNYGRKEVVSVNIGNLLKLIKNKFPETKTVDKDLIAKLGLIKEASQKVKLINSKKIITKINFTVKVDYYSKTTKDFA